MRRIMTTVALVLCVGFGVVALSGCKRGAKMMEGNGIEVNMKGMAVGGWCEDCGKGMVNGKEVKCYGCYKAKTGGSACNQCAPRE